jgi:ubiquitin C-terminal hydrolase
MNNPCGIINVANNCWLNSIIQCLNTIDIFVNKFLSDKYKEDVNEIHEKYPLIEIYVQVINLMQTKNKIKINSFLKRFVDIHSHFTIGEQHDSQEFIITFIEDIHEILSYPSNCNIVGDLKNNRDIKMKNAADYWSNILNDKYSIMYELFYGQYDFYIKCSKCDDTSYKYEPFCSIELPIEINEVDKEVYKKNNISTDINNIYDCLSYFTHKEEITKELEWKCEKCDCISTGEKQTFIWNTPEILIIMLKRFNYTNTKNSKKIVYPIINFNLQEYCNGYDKSTSIYDLCAVCCHVGDLNFGHYYAICKAKNDKWFNMNDEHIKPIKNIHDIITENAYILFYKKQH